MKTNLLAAVALSSAFIISAANASVETYKSEGVVQSVNMQAHTITIQQDSVTELGWPARTVSYSIDGSNIAQGVKAGDKVDFNFTAESLYNPSIHYIYVNKA